MRRTCQFCSRRPLLSLSLFVHHRWSGYSNRQDSDSLGRRIQRFHDRHLFKGCVQNVTCILQSPLSTGLGKACHPHGSYGTNRPAQCPIGSPREDHTVTMYWAATMDQFPITRTEDAAASPLSSRSSQYSITFGVSMSSTISSGCRAS